MCAKDRRHQGDGPWDAPSSAAPQVARTGSRTEAVVNHLLKNIRKVFMPELAPSRRYFCSPRLNRCEGREDPRGGRQAERTASSRAARSLWDFNPAEVSSGLSLISAVPPQLIPSSVAGRFPAGLPAAGQTRSCKIIADCTETLVSSLFLCCRTSFYCTWPSGQSCNSTAMITIFKRLSFWHFWLMFHTYQKKKKKAILTSTTFFRRDT